MSQLEKVHVLIVDDSATTRNSIAKHLGDAYYILHASDGAQAWQLIQSNTSIALVFADLHMPVMNGMVLLKQIRDSEDDRVSQLPVIMITGHEDTDAAKRASYGMGATDFISKPFSALDIISRAGSYTKLNRKIRSLAESVSRDTLTGLYNRHGLQELGEKAVAGAIRYTYDLSVLVLQISDVEEILGKHGRKVASQIIVSVAKGLKKSLRKEEIMAHIGGGQFAVLLPMTKAFRAHIVALRFQKAVASMAFKTGDVVIRVKLAAGLNSTEGYPVNVEFTTLFDKAVTAVKVSLQRSNLQIVRHDEVLSQEVPFTTRDAEKEFRKARSEHSTDVDSPESPVDNRQMFNADIFSHYMMAVFNGEFDQIPECLLEKMITPMTAFLEHARKQLSVKEA